MTSADPLSTTRSAANDGTTSTRTVSPVAAPRLRSTRSSTQIWWESKGESAASAPVRRPAVSCTTDHARPPIAAREAAERRTMPRLVSTPDGISVATRSSPCRGPVKERIRSVGGVRVVLEHHRADRRERERGAHEEQPPAEDESEEAGGGGDAAPQRCPRVRREEPELTGTVADVGVVEVLRPGLDPARGEQQVEADERAEAGAQRERGGAGRVVRGEPVNDVDDGKEDRDEREEITLDLHVLRPLIIALLQLGCGVVVDQAGDLRVVEVERRALGADSWDR